MSLGPVASPRRLTFQEQFTPGQRALAHAHTVDQADQFLLALGGPADFTTRAPPAAQAHAAFVLCLACRAASVKMPGPST